MDKFFMPNSTAANYFANTRPDMLGFVPGSARTVLDIGCGSGAFAHTVRETLGAEVWGVELSAAMAKDASLLLDKVISGPIQEHMDALPEQFFDCICMNDVLEHLVDPWLTLNQLRAKLTPNGLLIASIPNIRHYKNLWYLLAKGEWTYTDDGTLDRTHLRFFTPNSMRQLFTDSGYRIEQLQGIRGSRKMKARIWRYLSLGKLWDVAYPQFAVVAKPVAAKPTAAEPGVCEPMNAAKQVNDDR
jgi:2-polyprenyl-3-methyl-5-hydroxy-6-metoxy-1,4-benzoquinol methylase